MSHSGIDPTPVRMRTQPTPMTLQDGKPSGNVDTTPILLIDNVSRVQPTGTLLQIWATRNHSRPLSPAGFRRLQLQCGIMRTMSRDFTCYERPPPSPRKTRACPRCRCPRPDHHVAYPDCGCQQPTTIRGEPLVPLQQRKTTEGQRSLAVLLTGVLTSNKVFDKKRGLSTCREVSILLYRK